MLPDYKKYQLIITLCCFSITICVAQQKKENTSILFHSINQTGLLNGQQSSACQIQTINGFQYKSWFGGIGIGLDYYRFRGIPLFADIRKTFGHNKNKLFVYADGGIHFSWVTDKEKNNYGSPGQFSNGLYLDGGIGYQIRVNSKNAILLNLGYSYKKVKETVSAYPYFYYPMILVNISQNFSNTNTYNYHLNRISIKAGWEF